MGRVSVGQMLPQSKRFVKSLKQSDGCCGAVDLYWEYAVTRRCRQQNTRNRPRSVPLSGTPASVQEPCLLSEEKSAPTSAATLWQYVHSGDFAAPAGTVQQTVRTGLAGFWENLRQPDETPDEAFQPVDELHALPEALLRRAVAE